MSERWYVVREHSMALLDVIPGYVSNFDNNIRTRKAYSVLWNCDIRHISLLNDKHRAKNYWRVKV